MCKSFMACLQMTNNSLTVTVKFHYLRCFYLFVCIAIIVFRSFQHLFCTVIEMTIYPGFFIIWNDNLFIVFKYCLVPFGSISAVPCKGISNPPCTSEDLLWFLPMMRAWWILTRMKVPRLLQQQENVENTDTIWLKHAPRLGNIPVRMVIRKPSISSRRNSQH